MRLPQKLKKLIGEKLHDKQIIGNILKKYFAEKETLVMAIRRNLFDELVEQVVKLIGEVYLQEHFEKGDYIE